MQVERLRDPLTAEETFWRLSSLPHCLFLDSAMKHPTLGRYSFVAADPFAVIRCPVGDAGALIQLREALRKYSSPTHEGIPPFQGGAAGLLGYDLNQTLADTPRPKFDDFKTPALHVGLYDTVISFDHVSGEACWCRKDSPSWTTTRGAIARRRDRLSFASGSNAAVSLSRFRQRMMPDLTNPHYSIAVSPPPVRAC